MTCARTRARARRQLERTPIAATTTTTTTGGRSQTAAGRQRGQAAAAAAAMTTTMVAMAAVRTLAAHAPAAAAALSKIVRSLATFNDKSDAPDARAFTLSLLCIRTFRARPYALCRLNVRAALRFDLGALQQSGRKSDFCSLTFFSPCILEQQCGRRFDDQKCKRARALLASWCREINNRI